MFPNAVLAMASHVVVVVVVGPREEERQDRSLALAFLYITGNNVTCDL